MVPGGCLISTNTEQCNTTEHFTLYDHKTNNSVRHELQTECILDKIDAYRWKWILRLQRMPPNRIPLKSYHYRPQGRRTIGRLKKH